MLLRSNDLPIRVALGTCLGLLLAVPIASCQNGRPLNCNDLQANLDALIAQRTAEHDACLASHQVDRKETDNGKLCSRSACQSLHDWVYGDAGQRLKQRNQSLLDQCHALTNADAQAESQYDQLAADYKNQADAVQGSDYGMDQSQYSSLDSLQAQANSGVNTTGIDYNSAPPTRAYSQDIDAGTLKAELGREAAAALDAGIDQVPGGGVALEARDLVRDVNELRSGDSNQQIDGVFDLADKGNDHFNGNELSKAVTGWLLHPLKQIETKVDDTLNLVKYQIGNCIVVVTEANDCKEYQQRFDQIWSKPIIEPTFSVFGVDMPMRHR